MNKRERISATIAHLPVDRPPVALWRHFPGDDLDPERFAQRVVDFQRTYDFDFVKVTPAGSYSAEMYGAGLEHSAENLEGARTHRRRVVADLADWGKLAPLDVENAVFQRETASIRKIRAALGADTPIAQTIFSPLSIASRLAGNRFHCDMQDHPAVVLRALEVLAVTVQRFAAASIAAGADALFFATQMASRTLLGPDELRTFAIPYDLAVLEALQGKVGFVFLHVHGEEIYFDEMASYPVQLINWHDRKTPPALGEGLRRFAGAVAGGLDEQGVLRDGTPEAVHAQVTDAIRQTEGGRGLMIAAGCVTMLDTPEANLRAACTAVDD